MLTHFISTAYPHQKHLVSRFTDHSLQFADSCSRLVRVDFHTAEFVALPFFKRTPLAEPPCSYSESLYSTAEPLRSLLLHFTRLSPSEPLCS